MQLLVGSVVMICLRKLRDLRPEGYSHTLLGNCYGNCFSSALITVRGEADFTQFG